jgi:hypothetical protein
MMDISLIFYSVAAALGYILLQSLFILGVRVSAIGGTEKMPDGKERDSEMILYPILKFLHQATRNEVYYSGDQFRQLVKKIRLLLPGVDVNATADSLAADTRSAEGIALLRQLNTVLPGIDGQIEMDVAGHEIRFYKVYEEYRFNKYLRKPVLGCHICMASYWSMLTYWVPVIYFYGFSFWVLYLGVMNICAVAAANWLIAHKRFH